LRICCICFNTEGEARMAVSDITFSETDEIFDLCESHYQEIRELISGRKRACQHTDGVKEEVS